MTRGQPTRTRLDPRTRRAQILDATETVLRERPPGELTFEAVAEAAGVSRALVYNYFGDRNGLLAAVELRTLGQLNAQLHATVDTSLDPADQLRPLAIAYLAFAHDHGLIWRVLAASGVQHPSLEVARRTRVERLATLWGGTKTATIAAQTVTVMLEAATVGWPGGQDSESGTDAWLEIVCRILTDGLDVGLAAVPTPH